jgi:hypothetical protein
MSKKPTYHLTPHPSGWQVKREGASRASVVLPTKAAALDRAREIASNQEGALKIHGLNGRIQQEHTYHEDPYPPRG